MEAPLTSLTPRPGYPPQSGQNRPPQGESGFADSSGPLFAMYLGLSEEEDKKMTENWKGDADGILFFVSLHSTCSVSTHVYPEHEDWFILRRRRSIRCGIRPGPQAKFPGYLGVLPGQHLSNTQWLPDRYAPLTFRSVHVFSTNLCHMGQLTLDSQLAHQSHMRTFGHITPAMGPEVHEGHTDTIQSTQTSTDSSVLCGGHRQTSPSVGSRSVAYVIAPLSFPLLRRPHCFPFQYQSYGFQGGHIVGRILYRHVYVHHILAGVSA